MTFYFLTGRVVFAHTMLAFLLINAGWSVKDVQLRTTGRLQLSLELNMSNPRISNSFNIF